MKIASKFGQLIILILLSSNLLLGQTSKNKIKIIYGYHVPNNGKMSDERYSYLIADNLSSFFVTSRNDFPRPENQVIQDVNNISIKVFDADDIGSYVFRDFKKESIVFREVGSKFTNAIIVTDKWEIIKWEIINETKNIGEYNCRKATGKFRGRSYTAWFTEDIPIPSGPWKLYGLPGIILEAFDSQMEFYAIAKEIKINMIDDQEVKITSNNSELKYDFEEYRLYRKNYKETYVNSIKAKLPRGSNLNIKPSDIKLSPIESEIE
jgi:GLPGLI family protein